MINAILLKHKEKYWSKLYIMKVPFPNNLVYVNIRVFSLKDIK